MARGETYEEYRDREVAWYTKTLDETYPDRGKADEDEEDED